MSKINVKNEKMKKLFEKYCKNTKGYDEKTINCYLKSVYAYEEFTKYECFSKYNDDKAVNFREHLVNADNKRALSTIYDYLRYLKVFFIWLSDQQGYKKSINKTHIEALRLSREQTEMALAPQRERYPSLEIIQAVVHTMPINNELDRRDRALISFTLLSGMRDKEIINLPIECFYPQDLEIYHTPKKIKGIKGKKTYQSYLFPFDAKMIKYILEWCDYLVKTKLYPLTAPLFPRNKVEQAENSKSFICNTFEPEFWKTTTPMTEIFKKRFEEADMEYYSPHCFRHTANRIVKTACRSTEEFQAISQNFGHQNMGTTFSNYGKLPAYQVKDIIQSLDFSSKKKNLLNDLDLQEYQDFLKFQEFKRMQNVS